MEKKRNDDIRLMEFREYSNNKNRKREDNFNSACVFIYIALMKVEAQVGSKNWKLRAAASFRPFPETFSCNLSRVTGNVNNRWPRESFAIFKRNFQT